MKIGVISASHNPNSQSQKVGKFLSGRLEQKYSVRCINIELQVETSQLWNSADNSANEMSLLLQDCQGFIFVIPEYNGMATPIIKNMFLTFGYKEFGHKPCLLVGVSSGLGGTYVISEMRSSSYKNSKICYVPEQVIIRGVNEILNSDLPKNESDKRIRDRIDYSLDVFIAYVETLNVMRNSERIKNLEYKFGM